MLSSIYSKYFVGAIVGVFTLLVIGLGCLYYLNAQKAEELVNLRKENATLAANLKAEKEWSQKQSKALAERDQNRKDYDKKSEQSQNDLEKKYEKHSDWSDASVPDDIADGLSEHLDQR